MPELQVANQDNFFTGLPKSTSKSKGKRSTLNLISKAEREALKL
jgi:hypothetical protein